MIKVDMHLHSEYSERPTDWFLKRLGTKESYTGIEEIYTTAKERGMDLVTITDHNRIDGVLKLKERYPEDVFTGVESTVYFPDNGCKIHLLIYDFTQEQFSVIQELRKDVYKLRNYLRDNNLLCSVAHATYSVNGRLSVDILEKLILLFNNFERFNASHNPIFNDIWIDVLESLNKDKIQALSKKHNIEPWGSTPWLKGYTGGSDDHSGLFIAKNHTAVVAKDRSEFIERAKLQLSTASGGETDFKILPFMVYKIAWDFIRYEKRGNDLIKSLTKLIKKNRKKTNTNPLTRLVNELNRSINDESFNFSNPGDLDRIYKIISSISDSYFKMLLKSFEKNIRRKKISNIIRNTSAALPALFLSLPFYSNLKHINSNRELFKELGARFNLKTRDKEKRVLWFSDTLNDINGVAENMKKIAYTSNTQGYKIKIVVCEEDQEYQRGIINIPPIYSYTPNFYSSNKVTIPSILRAIELISREKPDQIIISTPGPMGFLGLLISKLLNVHVTGIYHTDFAVMSKKVFNDEGVEDLVTAASAWFYNQMDTIKVPSNYYIQQLITRGYNPSKMSKLVRGIDLELFTPEKRVPRRSFDLLWVGRVGKEKNIDFLYEIIDHLTPLDDLTLTIAGDGPELKDFKRKHSKKGWIKFTGRVDREDLTTLYASSDLMIFPSIVDTFGMVILESQASGLPAIVTNMGGPQEIIENSKSGFVLNIEDSKLWADKIKELYSIFHNNPGEYQKLRDHSRSNAMNKYSWEGMIRDVIAV